MVEHGSEVVWHLQSLLSTTWDDLSTVPSNSWRPQNSYRISRKISRQKNLEKYVSVCGQRKRVTQSTSAFYLHTQSLCGCHRSLSLIAFLLKKALAYIPLNHKKRNLLDWFILASSLFLTTQRIALNLEMSSDVIRIGHCKSVLLNSLREEKGLF